MSGWQEGFFNASDGVRLFYRVFIPANPRKSLVILHGFGEHSYRYEKFASYFPDFQISLFEMRGMGRSEGKRVYVESFDSFERDALDFLVFLEASFPSRLPRVLLGHSLGGLNLMRLHVRHQVQAERFVFSAPCFRVAVPDFALSLNRFLESRWPEFVYHNPVYFKNLTHDPAEMESYRTDPLIMRRMTTRLLNEMVEAGKFVERLESIHFGVPVHFLLAGEDKLVRTATALKVFEKVIAPQKTLKVYNHFFHEIFNERGQAAVFEDLSKILQ